MSIYILCALRVFFEVDALTYSVAYLVGVS